MVEPSEVSSPPPWRRTEIIVAAVGAVGVIVVALVTGLFGLLSGDGGATEPTATVIASGGSSTNSNSCVSGGVVVQGTVNCAPSPAPQGGESLRLTVVPRGPRIFHVAFGRDIGLPAENATYEDLLAAGGVDVGTSLVRITLANRSDKPLSVTDVHLETIGTEEPPRAAIAFVWTQGDGPVAPFAALLHSASGSVADLYEEVNDTPGYAKEPPIQSFFSDNYISLKAGEIYEAEVAVETDAAPAKMVKYRVVVSGSTAATPFTIASSTIGRVSNLSNESPDDRPYEREYVDGFLSFAKVALGCTDIAVRRWYAVPPAGLGDCP